MTTFKASGKLLLFGEYLVLNGANCLAIPLQFGQKMQVENVDDNCIYWESYSQNKCWFSAILDDDFSIVKTSNHAIATTLQKIFHTIKNQNPTINFHNKFKVEADFNLNWGLGSSSTLISLLSQWSDVDAYELQRNSFGGSGYDIACATTEKPIIYSKQSITKTVDLSPTITQHLLFIYSGKKQNSRVAINNYKRKIVPNNAINTINCIIDEAIQTEDIVTFENQIYQAESLLAGILNIQPLKEQIFIDYPYAIKSLGAWGGDFFMATFRNIGMAKQYFQDKGCDTIFTYEEIIK